MRIKENQQQSKRSGRENHKLDFVEIFFVIVDKVQHFEKLNEERKNIFENFRSRKSVEIS